jgi:nicotinate-nucleotide pyrophosphorylase (carboxylating)
MTIARTPYDDLPVTLTAELAAAGLDPERVYAMVADAFEEDLPGGAADVTSAAVPDQGVGAGGFVAREAGVVAGLVVAELAFVYAQGEEVEVTERVPDGTAVQPGDTVLRVAGPLAGLLTAERTALNFARHLSGVATLTRRFVDAVGPDVLVWDTRKTIPGLRSLEKAAVRAGGGANHRGNLSDWVMLKDNHLAVLDVAATVAEARRVWPARTIHVECDSIERAMAAAEAGADALLLDNLGPEDAAKAVTAAREALAGRPCFIEASGGITLETVAGYADTGVDAVSAGALTDSAKALDLGLDVEAG